MEKAGSRDKWWQGGPPELEDSCRREVGRQEHRTGGWGGTEARRPSLRGAEGLRLYPGATGNQGRLGAGEMQGQCWV